MRKMHVALAVVGVGAAAAFVYFFSCIRCSHYPTSTALTRLNEGGGYRFGLDDTTADNTNRVFVTLVFSGGGTRAAAFSYGVLRELDRVSFSLGGSRRSLLDEVDVISSVSGGSFTAAYFSLWGKDSLPDFEQRFLKWNAQDALIHQAAVPRNARRLRSRHFGRSDLAAELWDRHLFRGRTFGEIAGRRPYWVANATDMSRGTQFPFTREYLDPLCIDLDSVPISRAVAASSAFPALLTPLTVDTHAGNCDYALPQWVRNALRTSGARSPPEARANPAVLNEALTIESYTRTPDRKFIHLLDGGVSDNLGARVLYRSLVRMGGDFSIFDVINDGTDLRHHFVFITVNARTRQDARLDGRGTTPSLLQVLRTVADAPMSNFTDETVARMEEQVATYNQQAQYSEGIASRDRYYWIHVTFDSIADPKERRHFQALPTSFSLPPGTVDELIAKGGELLRCSQDFRLLLTELEASAQVKPSCPD
jgi:NTE family protein